MNAKDVIKVTLATSARFVNMYLEDLTDPDLLIRPVPGTNHIAWQIGHLIASEHRMMESIQAGAMPPLPDRFLDAHKKDAAASDDPKQFFSKQQYLDAFNKQREGTLKILSELPEKDLDNPAPEKLRALASTNGALLNLVGTHYLIHVGQWVPVRRKIGKKPII